MNNLGSGVNTMDPKHCNIAEAATFTKETGILASYIRKSLCAKGRRQSTYPYVHNVTIPCDICKDHSCEDCTVEYEVCLFDIPDVSYRGVCSMRMLYYEIFNNYEDALKSYEAL